MNIQRIGWATTAFLLSTATARADDYIFTRLADTSGVIVGFPSLGAVLNNNGVAAVQAVLVDGRDAIVRLDGGTPTIIADDAGSCVFFGLPLDNNDLGDVAFKSRGRLKQTPGSGVWVGDGEAITTIGAPFDSPFGITFYTTPSINDNGLVSLLVAGPSCPVGNGCIGIGSGGPITFVYTTDNIPAGTHIGVQTDMSETGQLVFSCYDSKWPNNGLTYLYRGTMGGAWPIEIDQVSSSGGFASVAVNNNGAVAYLKHINGVFDAGIYIGDEAGVTAISTTDGPFYEFHFQGVAINDSNDVAFTALLPGGSYGVYTGPDPIADKVIASGDPLDGSTVGFVLTTRFGLNNAGQIALFAGLDDGRQGIYLATPVALCPWDLDNNGTVGVSDLLALLADWGPCKGCPADFDDDDNVGVSDLLALLANWGPCP